MESAYNHHHHQPLSPSPSPSPRLQDHVVGSSSSSSISSATTPSNYYGLGTTTHAWGTTPTSFMNTNATNGLLASSYRPREHTLHSSSQYTAPDLAFHTWDFTSVQDLQLPRIKGEFSNHYYRKYADLLNGNGQDNNADFGTKLLLKSYSSESLLSNNNVIADQISSGDLYGRRYSQIFPSINVSSLNQMGLTNGGGESNLEMNLEALDLLTSSSFSGNYSQNYQIGMLRDHHAFSNHAAFDDHTHQIPLYDTNKMSAPSSHGSAETKRSSNKIDPKAPSQKKSRLEARASCPPFKVTKEKLGDRIATLQQLVAPFGKTDTASVLMEAIGYIKFLQDQVETLSVPYMKASRNKSTRSGEEGLAENQNKKDEESKRDLRSRGLCLVPLSCLSYITDGGAAVVWPPPHFGGPA